MPSPRAAPARLFAVAAALCVGCASADLPVHCLRHQIAGEWDFHLGPPSVQRSSCGHQSPDSQDHQPQIMLSQVDDVKKVSLQLPNLARTKSSEGDWTMIYDEGFEVNVDGLSLFAFSRFDLKSDDGVPSNVSLCGETQLGWYHDLAAGRWGCYYARRRAFDDEDSSSAPLAKAPSRGPAQGVAPEAQSASSGDADVPAYDEPLGSLYHSTVAAGLNLVQDLWTAKAHDRLAGKSLREINGMAGIRRPFRHEEHGGLQEAGRSFLQTRQRPALRRRSGVLASDEAALPTAWDWRNVSGASYLDAIMDQGDCGSCYTVATIHMLSARHRIRQRDPSLESFSVGFPLQCSEYNQGCDGGYAFLASRWSQEVGLVPKSCAEYQGSRGSCSLDCAVGGLRKRWRADNHHYIGGYYGAASEAEMMRELVEGGPLVASFEPKVDFMYYNGGIYKTVPNQRAEWEKVDHAVLLVGYGEENGQKYWTLQNSWGAEWGEGGFFRMARGSDESGIESIVVAADVVEDTRPPTSLLAFAQQQSASPQ